MMKSERERKKERGWEVNLGASDAERKESYKQKNVKKFTIKEASIINPRRRKNVTKWI